MPKLGSNILVTFTPRGTTNKLIDTTVILIRLSVWAWSTLARRLEPRLSTEIIKLKLLLTQ